MNKVLRTALVAVMVMVSAVAAKAQAVGEQITLGDKVYKVVSDNLIANAGFEEGFAGWTSANDFATELSASKFKLQTEEGHGNFLVGTTNEGAAGSGSLGTAWAIEANKTYYYAYDVKSLGTAAGNQPYLVSSLTNTKGGDDSESQPGRLGTPTTAAGKWTAFEKVLTNTDGFDWLQVKFRWLSGQFGFDNFRLLEVAAIDQDIVDAYNETNAEWRDAQVQITTWEQEVEGQILSAKVYDDATVEEVMDKANKDITDAWEAYFNGITGDVTADAALKADTEDAFAAALAEVAKALAVAKKIYGVQAALNEIPAGKYIIQEAATGKFFGPGNAWGTQASLIEHPVEWVLAVKDGAFTLESIVSNGGTSHYLNWGWCDGGEKATTLVKVGEGLYNILQDNSYYLANSSNTFEIVATEGSQFRILPADPTTAKRNDDVSYVIKDANFDRNNRYQSAWTVEASNKNLSGGTDNNRCAESFHSAFSITQKVNVPEGYYTLTAQGFYRQDGSDNENLPALVANKRSKTFPLLTGTENNMNDASNSFAAGNYQFSVEVYVHADGVLELGFKNTNTNVWAIFDNVGLIYRANNAALLNAQAAPELGADTIALQAKLDAALATVNALPDYARDAVKDQVAGLKQAVADAKAAVKASVTANTHGKDQDALEEQIDAINAQIDAYVATAQKLVDGNDGAAGLQNEAVNGLIAQWQEAYDDINTKYKEYVGSDPEKFQNYLRSLNNIYVSIDALAETVKGYEAAGTAVAKADEVNEKVDDLSAQIDAVVETALNTYESEVAATNAAEKAKLDAKAAEIVKQYQKAIEFVNDHYATYHAEEADWAHEALFAIYEYVTDAQKTSNADFKALEASNAAKFAAKDFPLEVFDIQPYADYLDAIDLSLIERTLTMLESYAASDNASLARSFNAQLSSLSANYTAVKAQIDAYNVNLASYKAQTDAIDAAYAKLQADITAAATHKYHEAVEAKAATETEPAVEAQDAYWDCIFQSQADFSARIADIQAQIAALAEQAKADENALLLAAVEEQLDAAQDRLDVLTSTVATFLDGEWEPYYEADLEEIQDHIDQVRADATAAAAAGTLIAKNADIQKAIGDLNDLTSLPAEEMDEVEVDTDASVKYTAGVVNEKIGDAEPGDDIEAYKLGTGAAKGKLVLTVPEGATGITFTAAIWNGTADDKLIVKAGDATLATLDIKANTGVAGNSPYTVVFADDAAKAAATYTVDFPAALTEATAVTFELETSNRFVVWNVELAGGPAAPSIAQELNLYELYLQEDQLYVKYYYEIDDLFGQLEDAAAVAEGLGQELPYYDAIGSNLYAIYQYLLDDFSYLTIHEYTDWYDYYIAYFQSYIDYALHLVYQADLQAQIVELKKQFNNVTVDPELIDAEIDTDFLWNEIETESDKVDAETAIDADRYQVLADEIANIGLLFTDYQAWIAANTLKGDINVDEQVTVADVVKVVDLLLNTDNVTEEGEELDIDLELSGLTQRAFFAGDTNDDEKLDGADLENTINIMLGKEVAAGVKAEVADAANDYVVVDGKDIALVNAREYTNFTLVVKVADGANLTAALTERTNGMQLGIKQVKGNIYKILVYSASNAAIDGNEGNILSLNVDGITVTSANFTANGIAYALSVEDVTGIRGIEAIDLAGADIYTIAGAKTSRLQKGVNVIRLADGTVKKVLVK